MEQNNDANKDTPQAPADKSAKIIDNTEQEEEKGLGLAGVMAKAFIHSPLSPLLFIAMLAMGIMGLMLTPRQEDPQISVPMVDVFVAYPGASAKQVSSLAVEPLQIILSEIPDVKHVYGVSEHGQGMVTVQFKVGEEMEKSIFKIYDKLSSYKDKMPPGVSEPIVKPKSIDDVPVVTITLWSTELDDGSLRGLGLDVLNELKAVTNTGQGFVVGGRSEQMRVEIIPERLTGFSIGLEQIANVLQAANTEIATGHIESAGQQFTVYSGHFLKTATDVGNLVVGSHEGMPVYIRDVANVIQGPEIAKQMVTYYTGKAYKYDTAHSAESEVISANAAPAVTIAIAKKIGTNGVEVANSILAKVKNMQGRIIPHNVHVETTRDYGKSANSKVNGLIKKLFIATGAVTVLVWWALGWRPALVVTLVIPVVILVTIFAAFLLGFTIDRVSLFALIFSIGILVDDAIVVMENIYRRWLLAENNDTATAIDAVREVGNPTILATFTVVAALLPMGFVSGMMGPYMMPIPVLGSVAMIISLVAAFIFTPWLAMIFKPSMAVLKKGEEREHAVDSWLEKLFRRILTPLFKDTKKGMVFLISLLVAFFLAISMFGTNMVEVKMLPLDNKPEFNVFIDMPEGTALPVTANLTYQLAEALRQLPEVTALQTYVGTSQPFDFNGMVRHYYLRNKPWQADIHLQLKGKSDRKRSSHEIALEARRIITEISDRLKSTAKLTVVEMPPGPPVLQSVVAEVYGPDDKSRNELVNKLTDIFAGTEILDDTDNYIPAKHDIWHFVVDTEKATRKGVSINAINQTLAMAMGSYRLGDIKSGSHLEPTYLIMQVPLEVRSQLTQLYDIPVPTINRQETLPLAELGHFVRIPQDRAIFHKNLRRVEYVVGDSVGIHTQDGDKHEYTLSSPIYGMLEVEEDLVGYTNSDGTKPVSHYTGSPKEDNHPTFEWTGEWTVTYETFRDMGIAFAVAIILIYILVVGLFGNFIVPAIIMAPIPLTLLGIIPAHWIADAEFTATSMIGWIALAGIIVRNSILLVDYSIFELRRGSSIEDAVILACKTRTRPIMITAFALVGGSSVILSDPIFQGMAISLLSGVLVSTLLTLIVIPLGCITFGDSLCQVAGLNPNCGISDTEKQKREQKQATGNDGWFTKFLSIFLMVFYLIRAIITMLFELIKSLFVARKTTINTPPPVSKVTKPQTDPATIAPKPKQAKSTNKTEATTTTSVKETPVAPKAETKPKANPKPKTPAAKKPTAKAKATAEKKPAKTTAAGRKRGIRLKTDLPKKSDDSES